MPHVHPSKFWQAMTVVGHLHTLPRRSIAVRFTPINGHQREARLISGCGEVHHSREADWFR
jgi:hypothetical protein